MFRNLTRVPRDFSASALFASLNACIFAILKCKLVYSFSNRIRSSSNSLILIYYHMPSQNYLSISYLDQKYLLSEQSELREISIDPSNVC